MANNIKPGSLNVIWAATGSKVDPGAAKSNTGWVVELPPYQTQNWIDWKQDSFIAHINQHGIPQWDSETEYQAGTSYTMGSNGIVYRCTTTHTNQNPVSTTAYWTQAWESYGSVRVVSDALAAHLIDYNVLAGIGNTGTARSNLSVYSKAETDAKHAPIAGNSAQPFMVGTATDPNHAVPLKQLAGSLVQATESTLGVAMVATNAKVAAGTDDQTFITPLKAANSYLSKAGNLAGLANAATARTNLGLGTMALEAATGFLRATGSLSELTDKAQSRANLGLTSTATQPETYFLRAGLNLSDLGSVAAARANLGLTSTATTDISLLMLKSDNFAGIANVATARANLGLADTATIGSGNLMFRVNNLSDVSNVQAARNNLGLGNLATKNVTGIASQDLDFVSNVDAAGGGVKLPDGTIMNWGSIAVGQSASFRIPFTVGYSVTCQHGPDALGIFASGVSTKTLQYFTLSYGRGGYMWIAIGR